ncbi:DEAD/DEAH box helicase, partial [Micromonospora sediminicola]
MADDVAPADGVLAEFGAATREWFAAAFAAPTPAQRGAWHSVAAGRNALVVAPTGSGKTLAAFLWSLDRLAKEPPPADPRRRCRVLYVSPLKALAVDVERNLRAPLTGIRQAATRLDLVPPDITVGMRTGDTPADERRAFARTPPDILITTPESLFLLLTSAARDSLRGVDTVIVDEVHAVAGTKRGAHLALSLERLDALLERPAQRIGLSATVRPIDVCARFLGGARPVDVVQPPADKTIEVSVQVPVEDMTRLDEQEPPEDELGGLGPRRPSIWPAVEERVLGLIRAHRSTIVFTNSRRSAERLCARLNELAAEELEASTPPGGGRVARGGEPVRVSDLLPTGDGPPAGDGGPADGDGPADAAGGRDGAAAAGGADAADRAGGRSGAEAFGGPVGPVRAPRQPAEVMAQSGAAAGAPPVIARAHHGSVSREERKHIEEALKSGQLPAVV